jgi:hypothetical protein
VRILRDGGFVFPPYFKETFWSCQTAPYLDSSTRTSQVVPCGRNPIRTAPPAAPEGWYCKYYVYPPPRDVVDWLDWLDWAPVWRVDHWCFNMGRDGPRSQSLQDQTRPQLVRRHDGLMNSVWASPSSSLHSFDEPRCR